MSLDAMKQALEALEFLALENFVELDKSLNVGPTHGRKAIIALRAAIEQAQGDGVCRHCNGAGCVACDARHLPEQEPRRWQGLTDEELRQAYCEVSGKEWCLGGLANAHTFYEAIEAKLKEKNT